MSSLAGSVSGARGFLASQNRLADRHDDRYTLRGVCTFAVSMESWVHNEVVKMIGLERCVLWREDNRWRVSFERQIEYSAVNHGRAGSAKSEP